MEETGDLLMATYMSGFYDGKKLLSSSRMLADAQIEELLDFVEYACVRFAPDQEDAIRRGEEILIKHGRMERPRVG